MTKNRGRVSPVNGGLNLNESLTMSDKLDKGENPCHVLLVLLGLMSAPHCTHVRAALVSIKESS